jgi:hypothetical protein
MRALVASTVSESAQRLDPPVKRASGTCLSFHFRSVGGANTLAVDYAKGVFILRMMYKLTPESKLELYSKG